MASIYATRETAQPVNHLRVWTDDDPRLDTEAALAALNDAGCRELLAVAGDEARTARELIQETDMARSTGYRKIDLLEEAGLFEEGLRLRREGGHASEYTRAVDEVTVSMSPDDGIQVDNRAGAAPACD